MNADSAVKVALQKSVDAGEIAGAATLAWHSGNIQTVCAGWRDREANLPVERDTIFRLASMTKPVTSLAALILVEQGRFALSDPISRYAPEFSEMRVLRSPEGPLDDTVAAERQITFEDLLTHRSGLTYADFHKGPITQAYRKALGGEIDSDALPDEWIAALAKLPLIAQPGSGMYYSRATDLLGLLIARAEGMPLGSVLKRLLFGPLQMKDTGFLVPRENRHRRASGYGFDDAGRLLKLTEWGVVVGERPDNMTYESGGTGLWSTVDDYLKFSRLFVSGGEVDGVRLLRPETVAMMASNRLTDSQRANYSLLGQKPFAVGRSFGLGVSVVLATDKADFMRRGKPGTVSWPGAWGAWWQADPKDGSVLIFLATSVARMDQMSKGIGLGVWAAISEFQRLAS
jgi:CubicO group peptidase (beta-lactamase class C family)